MSRVRFQSILAESILRLIVEGRKENALKKYPDMTQDIEAFAAADPSGNLKYLDWQAKLAHQGADPEQLINIAKLFDQVGNKLSKKDINAWTIMKLDTLEAELKDIQDAEALKASWKKQDKEAAQCDQKVVLENDEVLVRHIMSKKASIHYGRGTRWCITMADQPYFEDYSMDNVVFFFVFRKQKVGDDLDKIAISAQRAEDNSIAKIEYWDSFDDEIGEQGAAKAWGKNFPEIMAVVNQVCATYKVSPMAAFFSGKADPDEAINLYFAELKGGRGIYSRQAENFVLKVLRSKHEYPSEIIDDIAYRAMMEPYAGNYKLEVLESVADRGEITLPAWSKLYSAKFNYDGDKKQLLRSLFSIGGPVPPEFINDMINKIISDPTELDDYELIALQNAPEITREQQIDLVYGVDASRSLTSVYDALLKRRKPLDPSAIDHMVDKLVSLHKAAFRPGVAPDSTTETVYIRILKIAINRNDITDHAKQTILSLPYMKSWFGDGAKDDFDF